MISRFFTNKFEILEEATTVGIVENAYTLVPLRSDMIVGKDVMNDLEVFQPYDNKSHDTTLVHKLNKATTMGGRRFVETLLAQPQYNRDLLQSRIDCMQTLGECEFSPVKEQEDDFMWLHSENEDAITDLLNSIYFNNFLTKGLNRSECALTSYNIYRVAISPVLGVISPLIYFVLPFLILKIKFGNKVQMSFATYIKLMYKSMNSSRDIVKMFGNNGTLGRLQTLTYALSLLFYFQGILNSTDIAYTSYKIIRYLSDKINNAMAFLKSSLEFVNANASILANYSRAYVYELDHIDPSLVETVQNYKPYTKFSILSHFGTQLKLYKTLKRSDMLPLVNRCYLLDGLYALKRCKDDLSLRYVTLSNSNDGTPRFASKGCWNIHLHPTSAVTNDLDLTNTIITGPNAGGKSTLIKMICTNVLLAQTIGFTSSTETEMTPFYFINTQINIPDCKGHESLFEAEMNRCLYNLHTIEEHHDKPSLVVMDEIFNSTNVVEAIAGAYAILEKMASFRSAISLITTHLTYLTKLQKTSAFECRCMYVQTDTDGTISYPYLLKNGVSKQYIALELLRDRGFSQDIITNALKIKERFVRKRV